MALITNFGDIVPPFLNPVRLPAVNNRPTDGYVQASEADIISFVIKPLLATVARNGAFLPVATGKNCEDCPGGEKALLEAVRY
jgi:hypothetical protein